MKSLLPGAERPVVQFENVGMRYGLGPEVLSDVSFRIAPRSFQFLTGPSGAGKTTLLRLVPRLWEASGGAVLLGGVDVRALPLDVLLAQISMVFQEVFLFHGTVRENLRLARPDAGDEQIVVLRGRFGSS